MKYIVDFSENGKRMQTSLEKEDATEADVVEMFGLNEPDIDWYKITKVKD